LTGATGFIGRFLLRELTRRGYRIRVLLRQPRAIPPASASAVIGDIRRPQNMAAALADIDAVVHTAGAAPAMTGLPEDDYRLLTPKPVLSWRTPRGGQASDGLCFSRRSGPRPV
jgi:uncharacterized protein YbjT (DUF2867 family)